MKFNELESSLPRHLRGGLAATFDTGPLGGFPGGVKMQAVYTRQEDLNDGSWTDADLYGTDLTLGGILALRYGHDSRLFEGSSRYGVGLILYDPARLPVGLWADWTRLYDGEPLFDHLDMYSLRVRVDF